MSWFESLGTLGNILHTALVIFEVLMVFNLMILVHEWGHFLAARWRGLHVDRFQIWFGKPLWKKTINGVQYGLGWIPAGGFVSLPQMAPMEAIEGATQTEQPLPAAKPLDKIIVAFAGPLFSILLAATFALGVKHFGKPESESRVTTVIGYAVEEAPAYRAGLRPGDRILEIDGQPIKHFEGFVDSVRWAVIASEGEFIEFRVERPGEGVREFRIPAADTQRQKDAEQPKGWTAIFKRPPLKNVGLMGKSTPTVGRVQEFSPAAEAGLQSGDQWLAINGQPVYSEPHVATLLAAAGQQAVEVEFRRKGEVLKTTMIPRLPDERPENWERPLVGVEWLQIGIRELSYPSVVNQISTAARAMWNMISKLVSGNSDLSPAHMSGPVGIGHVYYNLLLDPDALLLVLWFSVFLNVNLAIMNMLPLPVLDGGHIVMSLGEMIRGKPVQGKILELVQTAFVLLIFGFMIFVTLKDSGDIASRIGDNGGEMAKVGWLPKEQRAQP